MKDNKIVIFWFRRDLRLHDNKGLVAALNSGYPVMPIFIFDTHILNKLDSKYDRRVDYIFQAISTMNSELKKNNSGVFLHCGRPEDIFQTVIGQYQIQAVHTNADYEPYAIGRDQTIATLLKNNRIEFHLHKDQVIFEKAEITKSDNSPYTVFTPYSKKWKLQLKETDYQPIAAVSDHYYQTDTIPAINMDDIGFQKTDIKYTSPEVNSKLIAEYNKSRNFPYMETTELGMALRFGTISIRKCVSMAVKHSDAWLTQLIWREFFMQILYHFPKVNGNSFKSQYDKIQWRNNEEEFQRWCEGKTGYLFVDAGMRQLNNTGFMHNRARMIAAGFLCKHLLIDWRWGEAYFAAKLNDFDLAANNGNWQWAAGCGCDAAPYFRIFNPVIQAKKFDPDNQYIRKWIPNDEIENAHPIIEHNFARERVIRVYKSAFF